MKERQLVIPFSFYHQSANRIKRLQEVNPLRCIYYKAPLSHSILQIHNPPSSATHFLPLPLTHRPTHCSHSPSMLHNLRQNLPILRNSRLQLLRQRKLLIIPLIIRRLITHNNIQINSRALTMEQFRVQTILAQINLRSIHGIHEDCGKRAEDLESEVRGFDDIDRGDERVDYEGQAGRVVDGDGVCFSFDYDGCFGAATNENGMGD